MHDKEVDNLNRIIFSIKRRTRLSLSDALKKSLDNSQAKKELVDTKNHKLSIARQCKLIGLARSSYYAKDKSDLTFSEKEEKAMQIMDEAHTQNSCYGARSHMKNLARYGISFGRHHVKKLMNYMGITSTSATTKNISTS